MPRHLSCWAAAPTSPTHRHSADTTGESPDNGPGDRAEHRPHFPETHSAPSQRIAELLAECAPTWRLHRELNRATERGQPCGHPCGGTQLTSFGTARMDSRLLENGAHSGS